MTRLWKARSGVAICFAVIAAGCGDTELVGFQDRAPDPPDDGLWVTFRVLPQRAARPGDNEFRAALRDQDAIDAILDWTENRVFPGVPRGRVLEGGEHNYPWSWHLDPVSVNFQENLPEDPNCRSDPIKFEEQDFWKECEVYAPGNARIIQVQDCREGLCLQEDTERLPIWPTEEELEDLVDERGAL